MDPAAQGLIERRESIDIIGEVTCWIRARWRAPQAGQGNPAIAKTRRLLVTDQRVLPGLSMMIPIAITTCRRARYAALPARAAARLPPAEAVVPALEDYRTSSNRPVGRLPCGQSGHNCRYVRPRSWGPVSFVPMRVMRSTESPIRVSSSVSLMKHPRFGFY
jgi:hypothetical protein